MADDNYEQLKTILATVEVGVKATYTTSPTTTRFLFPKAMGQTTTQAGTRNMVICAEMEEIATSPVARYRTKCWRCFVVEDLVLAATSFAVTVSRDRPPTWRPNDLRRQNCVDDVQFFR
jgi:hypothetical protein